MKISNDRDHKIGNFAPYTGAWNLEAAHRFSEHLTMRAKYLEGHGSGLVTISPQVVQGQNAFVSQETEAQNIANLN
jgi:hypothetical protein